jgi:uncharacterized protein YdhG (YjbR/CyaY superfamily)
MNQTLQTVETYIAAVSDDKKEALIKLRNIVKENIPKGFEECINYKMIGYVVPHSLYPIGYHCDSTLPLPFINIAAQQKFIAIYHMGIYANPSLMNWFTNEYAARAKGKLDMGKSCIRFKYSADIPYELMAELVRKMTVIEWISLYESAFRKK